MDRGALLFQSDLLKSKGIFLTGGGTGLGRSMALHFASLGARLFLVGRRPEPLKSVCEEIQRAGSTAAFASCDVRDYAAVEAASKTAESQIGEINTLVNNAAGNFMARTEKLTPNAFNAVVAIVLNGNLRSCEATYANCRSSSLDKRNWAVRSSTRRSKAAFAACSCIEYFLRRSACRCRSAKTETLKRSTSGSSGLYKKSTAPEP